jgi:hypothetical protein
MEKIGSWMHNISKILAIKVKRMVAAQLFQETSQKEKVKISYMH